MEGKASARPWGIWRPNGEVEWWVVCSIGELSLGLELWISEVFICSWRRACSSHAEKRARGMVEARMLMVIGLGRFATDIVVCFGLLQMSCLQQYYFTTLFLLIFLLDKIGN